MAVELGNWFTKKLSAGVAVFDILGDSRFSAPRLLAAERSSYKEASSWEQSYM